MQHQLYCYSYHHHNHHNHHHHHNYNDLSNFDLSYSLPSFSPWEKWLTYTLNSLPFLGAFAKLRIVTISFVMSVCLPSACPSFRPHATTRLQMDGFSWNLTYVYFSKICRWNPSFIKIEQEYRVITWRPINISDHILLSSSYSEKFFDKIVEDIKIGVYFQ